jgi:alkanesulfonate monooxygenase SsuD/methylene tetrahydromethanopterin reductase-like flavin-dependent oxidoreductase (luciferase family)
MDVGIGLPNAVLDVRGPELVEWGRRADAAGFSVLGTIGRIVYSNHDDLIALAAVAGATERIGLMTSVLVPAGRQAVLLAKQAATLSAVSNGRFRLGVGIGGREDDWRAIGAEPRRRGRVLEDLVATCRTVWAGEVIDGFDQPIGPAPVNLPLVLGGYSEPAWRRAGRLADALLMGPLPPDYVGHAHRVATKAAEEAGRPAPTLYAARYVALGVDIQAEADRTIAGYYAFTGPEGVARVAGNMLRTADAVRDTLAALEQVGVDEVCLWSATPSLDQVDRVADAALG